MDRQSRDRVRSSPSRVTGNGEANSHCKAFPGRRQVRGMTHRSIGVRVRPHRAPCGQRSRMVQRCEGQAAQELASI